MGEILEIASFVGAPVGAEAKANEVIKATRPHWGWFILFMIVAVLWVWFFASIAGYENPDLPVQRALLDFAQLDSVGPTA
jgi:hypothetical protein